MQANVFIRPRNVKMCVIYSGYYYEILILGGKIVIVSMKFLKKAIQYASARLDGWGYRGQELSKNVCLYNFKKKFAIIRKISTKCDMAARGF
jgi:hypothetical protein